MITEDFYSGEPVESGSPNLFISNDKANENEAATMASFAKYDYDPGLRQPQNPQFMYPGGYGYNQGIIQPLQQGIGAMPNPVFMQGGGYYPQQPYYGYQQPYYYGQQTQYRELPETVHIPGINLYGEYLPTADSDDKIEQMKSEYIVKREELEAERAVDNQSSVYGYNGGYGFNYYGASYYNPYQYNSLNQQISRSVETMKDEARENRMLFNLNMSKLAHNFAEDGTTEEQIEEMYRGKSVKTPTAIVQSPQELYMMSRLSNMVPFDNSQMYRDHEMAVQREFNSVIPKDADLQTTFQLMGVLWNKWEMEDEMHRRRDGSKLYNSDNNAYKYFIRKKAEERYRQEKGIIRNSPLANMGNFNPGTIIQNFMSSSPLSQVSSLADDGTLNVNLRLPCNVGSKTGQMYSVNSNEAEYEEKRNRFGAFVNSIESTSGDDDLSQIKAKKIDSYSG